MLKKIAHRLTIINALVFISVLGICAATVYVLSVMRIDADNKEDMQQLLTVLNNSIEAPEEDAKKHDDEDDFDEVPDIFQGDAKVENERSQNETIQWFDSDCHLLAQKGLLRITLPLNAAATFEQQQNEHALILTHRVDHRNKTIGYLRIGMPLAKSDLAKHNTLLDLILGTFVATGFSGIATLYLVRQSLKPVEWSMQRLTEFSADASHELQGPVMAIKTNAAVALKYSQDMRESDRTKIRAMLDAASQISTTIESLLRLADIEQTLPASELKKISVNEIIAHVLGDLEEEARTKKIIVETEVDKPGLSFTAVEADIKTALLNVLRNALTYSDEGQSVQIRAARISRYVEFQVEDSGMGIDARDLPRIYDRFWRSDKARSYRSGGNGLGLAITKSIVERYKGTIGVASKLGSGTRVTLRFPEIPG